MPAEQVNTTVRILNPASPVADTRAAVERATAQAYGAAADWSGTGWATTDWTTTTDDDYSYLVELDDPSEAATLVDGRWPASSPGIAVPQSAARSLGLVVGDTLTLDADSAVALRIDGIYSAVPDSRVFWENDPMLAAGDAENFPEPGRSFFNPVHAVGPLIAAPGGIDASGLAPAQLEVTEHPSFTSTDVAGLNTLQERAADAEIVISQAVRHPGGPLFVDTDLSAALDDVDTGLAATRATAAVAALLVLVLVVVAAGAVTRLLIDARAAELELLRARGASRWQRAVAVAIDAVVVGSLVAIISPWGGAILHALIVGIPPLASAGLNRWVLPDASVWLSSVVVATSVAVLISLPAATTRISRKVPTGAIAAETAVVVAASLMVWRVVAGEPQLGDPLLAATPAVVLGALAIVGGRIVVGVARPVATLTARSRGAGAPLAGWFAARGAGGTAGIVLVALSVGASVVVLGAGATWEQGVRDEAAVALGAPAREDAGDAGAQSDVDAALVIRRELLLSKPAAAGVDGDVPAASVQLLGLDAPARQLLTNGSAATAGGSAIAAGLPSADPADSGPLLPAGSTHLQAIASLQAPEGVSAELAVVMENPNGALSVVPLGTVPAGASDVPVSAKIAIGSETDPIRFVGVTLRVQQEGKSVDPVSVLMTLDSLTAQGPDGSAATSLAMGAAGGWLGSNSDDNTEPPTVKVSDSSVRLTVDARTGPTPVTYGAVGWDPTAPVNAVVPTALADDLDVASGADLTGFVSGMPVTLRMVGETTAVPGAASRDDLRALVAGLPSPSRGATTVVVDGAALAHRLAQGSSDGPLVDEFWFGTGAHSAVAQAREATAGDGSVVEAVALGQRMMEAPLRAEIPASYALAVWASLLLALVGFGARTAAVSRSRRVELAQLRAIGMSRRGLLGIASADTFSIAAGGIAVGLGAGLATLALVGIQISAAGDQWAVGLVVPWQAVTLLPLALLGALATICVAIAENQRSLPLSDLLRIGADR